MQPRPKPCRNCGHHSSAHQWTPGVPYLAGCLVPGCSCAGYEHPAKFERVNRDPGAVRSTPDPTRLTDAWRGGAQ